MATWQPAPTEQLGWVMATTSLMPWVVPEHANPLGSKVPPPPAPPLPPPLPAADEALLLEVVAPPAPAPLLDEEALLLLEAVAVPLAPAPPLPPVPPPWHPSARSAPAQSAEAFRIEVMGSL
jgi:hypothetical protein